MVLMSTRQYDRAIPAWQKGLLFLIGAVVLLWLFKKLSLVMALVLGAFLLFPVVIGQLGRPLRRDEKLAAGIMGVCLLVAGVAFSLTPGVWKTVLALPQRTPTLDTSAVQAASDRALEQIMYRQFHEVGVTRVAVEGSFMTVHVTRDFYHALFTNRLDGNRVVREWQALAAKNGGMGHYGTVALYSEEQKVAEADSSWTGEVKVRWLDD